MAAGFASGGGGGSILGFSPAVSAWNFGSFTLGAGGSLGSFIQEAQLDDFLYSFGGPSPKPRPVAITASRELPGSTHWDPAPVPVGKTSSASPSEPGVVYSPGIPLPGVVIRAVLPDFQDEGQPPIIFSPPPILLPGQTDPGGEERETQKEEEGEMAHTWTHVGSQLLGALFPGTAAAQSGVAGPGQVAAGTMPVPNAAPGVSAMYSGGTCPPMKTRTLTIDCATGQEVKRKRRRRPKLLTNGDMGTLFQIASLPNNANVRIALAGAIRR